MIHKKLNFYHIFKGHWIFTRHVSEPNVIITGTAHFAIKDDERILYTEEGTYHLHNDCQTCFQTHVYAITPNTFTIFKSNGVLLHDVSVEDTLFPVTAQHDHLCNQDLYHCQWLFHNNNHFDILYTVKGSKKDYQIKTAFRRTS